MKHRFSQDKRVITGNGQVSPARVAAVEALEAQGKDGATAEEMALLIGNDLPGKRPLGSLGQVLSYMKTDELVVCVDNRWYLTEYAPQRVLPKYPDLNINPPHVNGKIAPMVQKRSGKNVSIFTSPREMADVVKVMLVIKGQAFPVPLWGNMWICYGQTTPDWHVEKETYYNVETIRLLLKNGQQHEEHPSPSDIVTISNGV